MGLDVANSREWLRLCPAGDCRGLLQLVEEESLGFRVEWRVAVHLVDASSIISIYVVDSVIVLVSSDKVHARLKALGLNSEQTTLYGSFPK